MKLRPKFVYDCFIYQKGNDLNELKNWLANQKIEVLKFEEWQDKDFGDGKPFLEIYYKTEIGEVFNAELCDGWYIYVDECGVINALAPDYKEENYEEVG